MRSGNALLFGLKICVCGAVSLGLWQNASAEEKERELLNKGTLAETLISTGSAGTALDGEWGGTDIVGAEAPPISGSVSKGPGSDWILRVFNNTEDRYNVNLEVVQFDKRGRKTKSDYRSVSLRAGENVEKTLQGHVMTFRCALKLNNWKRFPKKKTKEELQSEIDSKKGEIEELEQQLSSR